VGTTTGAGPGEASEPDGAGELQPRWSRGVPPPASSSPRWWMTAAADRWDLEIFFLFFVINFVAEFFSKVFGLFFRNFMCKVFVSTFFLFLLLAKIFLK
jgi:hypothetical protein